MHHHATTKMTKECFLMPCVVPNTPCYVLYDTSAISHPDHPHSLPICFPSCPTVSPSFSPRYAWQSEILFIKGYLEGSTELHSGYLLQEEMNE